MHSAMKTAAIVGNNWSSEACDVLVIGIGGDAALGPTAAKVDGMHEGWLTRAVARGDISGKRLDTALIPSPVDSGPAAYLVVGTGDSNTLDEKAAFEIGAVAARRLSDRPRGEVRIATADLVPAARGRSFVAGAITGTAGQDLYQSQAKSNPPQTLWFADLEEEVVRRGTILGESINLTRRLVNEPASVIFPASFADAAADAAQAYGIEIEVWDESRLEAENCRALLAVGRGSQHESRLVKLRYRGADDDRPPIALVGKGVTFDSGGLSIKPGPSMVDMKCDMAGAATVLGTVVAAARLGLKENIVGLCGLAENMIAGNSFKLGDVLHTRSGKTVEVLNTDAEGRVVLADTLNVALDEHPRAIVDLATLTGACVVALGTDVCGLFTNDPSLLAQVRNAAEQAGELVWELPMFDFYGEQIRSKVADLKNVGDGRWGGAITAAKFLEEFVDATPWVHVDIAGPAFAESPKPFRDAGATGVMLRSLVRLLEST